MNLNVTLAIFWRNFVSYFINPTGYVFICLFVLMSAVAAFWPNDFFNNNLANLDQLHRAMPLILLVFIPAVTMGVWAEERSEGTDEVLLTLPASDLDVVVGKYLAVVAIFTVSLLFSISNVFVLNLLGTPDYGILAANYFGYWLMGLTMLSVGMVASFVTSNLTVAFILGLVFNAPLVALTYADVVIRDPDTARTLSELSVGRQFSDFGRGVVTLSGTLYFIGIVGSMLYVCMVLIGRRNWAGSTRAREGENNVVVENAVSGFVVFTLVASLVALGVSLGSQLWGGQGAAAVTQSTVIT
ncbi:MAG TPA: ABC transporter permease, partial [Pirellulales bacterium]